MTKRQIVSFGILALCILIMLPLVVTAQGQPEGGGRGGNQGPPQNLQVLPKDWTAAQIVMVMRTINTALGVGCSYCHVERATGERNKNGNLPVDAWKDDKETKKKARVMMRMVAQINMTLAREMGKPADQFQRVQCVTCHRGAAIPKVD
jgi:hypothetical protein